MVEVKSNHATTWNSSKVQNSKTIEGTVYRMRVSYTWRDLPSIFGFLNAVYQQFYQWPSKNKRMKIFKFLVDDPDLEWEFIDGTIVKADQHSANAVSNENREIGKSSAGKKTKIHMANDASNFQINFEIIGSEVHG